MTANINKRPKRIINTGKSFGGYVTPFFTDVIPLIAYVWLPTIRRALVTEIAASSRGLRVPRVPGQPLPPRGQRTLAQKRQPSCHTMDKTQRNRTFPRRRFHKIAPF
jgi:hypothetical protein